MGCGRCWTTWSARTRGRHGTGTWRSKPSRYLLWGCRGPRPRSAKEAQVVFQGNSRFLGGGCGPTTGTADEQAGRCAPRRPRPSMGIGIWGRTEPGGLKGAAAGAERSDGRLKETLTKQSKTGRLGIFCGIVDPASSTGRDGYL